MPEIHLSYRAFKDGQPFDEDPANHTVKLLLDGVLYDGDPLVSTFVEVGHYDVTVPDGVIVDGTSFLLYAVSSTEGVYVPGLNGYKHLTATPDDVTGAANSVISHGDSNWIPNNAAIVAAKAAADLLVERLTSTRAAKLDRDISTFKPGTDTVKLSDVDSVTDTKLRQLLLAFLLGQSTIETVGSEQRLTFLDQSGDPLFRVVFNPQTGVRSAAEIF